MENVPNQKITRQVSPQWNWLINLLESEQITFGEARIIFHNGQPVEVIELLRRHRYGQSN